MIKNMILWKLKDMPEAAKEEQIRLVKAGLENLSGKIPGMIDIHVQIDKLPTSNADMMLDTTLEDADALTGYAVNPDHNTIADTYIRPYIEARLCIDYEI